MKYPALDILRADPELALAVVDEFGPSAVEDLPGGISVFFATEAQRDAAHTAVAAALPDAAVNPRDVDDEDWARRSQENLTPITVGRVTVSPPWADASPAAAPAVAVTILPSMGFGTGHHATTRLCLDALQALDLEGKRVLDVGTGSGVLAITAALLGAAEALGIDVDPDAVANARDNLELNPAATSARIRLADLSRDALPTSDVVLANLTGAVLVREAARLRSSLARGGTLVVSGLQVHERQAVISAIGGAVTRDEEEAGWAALTFNFPATVTV